MARRGTHKRARAVRDFTEHRPSAAPRSGSRTGAAAGDDAARKRSLRDRSGRGEDRKGNQTAMYAMLGVGGIAVLGLIVVLANSGGTPARSETKKEVVDSLAAINITWEHPRVQSVAKWAAAIGDGTDLDLSRFSDFDALRQSLAITTDAIEPKAIEAAVLAHLKAHTASLVFREFQPVDGTLTERAMHNADLGAVQLTMRPRPGKDYHPDIKAQVTVRFRTGAADILVTGFDVDKLPPALRPQPARHKPHEIIAKPQLVERTFNGKTEKVAESELVPLEHLPEATPEQRQEIDTLIAKMINLESSGADFNRAARRLRDIGRPVVPRLLNKMYETPLRTENDRLVLMRLDSCMRDMTGIAKGFSAVESKESGVGGTDAERLSALKQWYAWWYRNHDAADFARAIDKSQGEDLFETKAEKDARKKLLETQPDAGSAADKNKRN